MADESPKLAAVRAIDFHTQGVVAALEEALEDARAGKIKSVAIVYEYLDGRMGHNAAFATGANRNAAVGRLHALATHITMNELLEWKPNG